MTLNTQEALRWAVGQRVGRYTITSRVCVGARNHLAAAISDDGETVLLRALAPAFDDELEEQGLLFDEALLLMRLSHRGVRRCIGIGKQPPMQVLEYLHGVSLDSYLRAMAERQHRFAVRHALTLTVQLAATLSYLHRHGVVHADVSPDNIIVTREGRAVLIDFTHGAWPDKRFERTLLPMPRKLAYNSPEHWMGAAAAPATDIYGLGVVLWEMLAGVPPTHVSAPVAGATLPPLADLEPLRPRLPARLVQAVRRMTAPTPFERGRADAAWVQEFEDLLALAAQIPPDE